MSVQNTLRGEASLSGTGLHTGKPVHLVFRPAPPNSGIRFFRSDLRSAALPARAQFVIATKRGTTLALGETRIHTVEHVLSACQGLGVDNVDILMDAPEPPAADGSALPFAEALLEAGIEPQPDAPRRYLRLPFEIRMEGHGSVYSAAPAERFSLTVVYENPHPRVGRQSFTLEVEPSAYLAELAGARTFCYRGEVEALRAAGLAKGGSLENTVVVDDDGYKTGSGGLRFPDELVRHKALDLLGDLALVGRSLEKVRITAERCGHTRNVDFVRLLNETAKTLRKVEA